VAQRALAEFGAYQKATELFHLVVDDMGPLRRDPRCYKLVSQQVAAVDSICANIEEGYGRRSTREYVRFLVIARGSAREARGRYTRMAHWLSDGVVAERAVLCDEIIGILTASIGRLQGARTGR